MTGLVLLALAAGGAFPWATCVVAVTFSAARLAYVLRRPRSPDSPARPPDFPGIHVFYALTLLYLLLALLPVPLEATRPFGSLRFDQNATVATALGRAAELGVIDPQPAWFALTRNKGGTLRIAALIVAAFGAAFTASTLRPPRTIAVLRLIVAFGVVLAVGGILGGRVYPQGATVWWFVPIAHDPPGPMGCFINRNHLGSYLTTLAPAALSLCVLDASRRRFRAAAVYLAALAVMSAATVLTMSRGAILVLALAVAATGVLLVLHGRRRAGWVILVAVAALGISAPSLAWPEIRGRFESLTSTEPGGSVHARAESWRDSFLIWRAYPVVGAGPEGFRMVHPQYRRTTRSSIRTHAENEYVQLLTDGGTVGLILAVGAVLSLWPHLRLRRPPGSPVESIVMATAVAGGLIAALAHAAFEFAPRVPLVSVTLATLLGLALADDAPRAAPLASPSSAPVLPRVVAAGSLLAAVALSCFHFEMRTMDTTGYLYVAPPNALAKALRWAPTSSMAWCAFGRAASALGTGASYAFGERCLTQATIYDPLNYRLWLELGQLRLFLDDRPGAREAFRRTTELRSWVKVPDVPEDGA